MEKERRNYIPEGPGQEFDTPGQVDVQVLACMPGGGLIWVDKIELAKRPETNQGLELDGKTLKVNS